MSRLFLLFSAGTLFLLPLPSFGQTLCIGEKGHPCTPDEQREMQRHICNEEKAPANLLVAHSVRLEGTFFDPPGAPLDFDSVKPDHRTIVQIKSIATGEILYAVPLCSNGEFEFESVPEGAYRLILVWMKDGNFERLPLTDQPKELRCSDLKECRISSKITFHGSDNPIDFCPPK